MQGPGKVRVLLTLEIRELGEASGIVRVTIHRFPPTQGATQEVVDDLYVEHDEKSWRVARVENVTRS